MNFAKHAMLRTAMLAVVVSSPVLAADGYSGPIIDTHAHIRLGERDAMTPDQASAPKHCGDSTTRRASPKAR